MELRKRYRSLLLSANRAHTSTFVFTKDNDESTQVSTISSREKRHKHAHGSSSAIWRATTAIGCCSTTVSTSSRSSSPSFTRSQRALRAEHCDLLRVIVLMKYMRIRPIKTVSSLVKSVQGCICELCF